MLRYLYYAIFGLIYALALAIGVYTFYVSARDGILSPFQSGVILVLVIVFLGLYILIKDIPRKYRAILGLGAIVTAAIESYPLTKVPATDLLLGGVLAFGGIGLSLLNILPRYQGTDIEYWLCAIGNWTTLFIFLWFADASITVRWLSLGLIIFLTYCFQRFMREVPYSQPQKNLIPVETAEKSLQLSAWLLGEKRAQDGSYENPEVQRMIDEIKAQGKQKDEDKK